MSVVFATLMALCRSVSWLLVALMIALAPLAQASPPDQTWLAGLYDNDDYDDVVLTITSTASVTDSQTHHDNGPVQPVTAFVLQIGENPLLLLERTPDSIRAPPTV